jgi:hypothetical protein
VKRKVNCKQFAIGKRGDCGCCHYLDRVQQAEFLQQDSREKMRKTGRAGRWLGEPIRVGCAVLPDLCKESNSGLSLNNFGRALSSWRSAFGPPLLSKDKGV